MTLFAMAWVLWACGGDDASQEQSTAQAREQAAENAIQAPQGMQETMKQVEKMTQSMKGQNGEAVEPINFRELKAMMPDEVNGLPRSSHSGETTNAMGFRVSAAKAKYSEGDQRIELTISDLGGVQMLLTSMAAWSMIEIDRESDTEMERTTEYEGYKAHQKYNFPRKRGEMTVLIGSRFVVQAQGSNVEMDQIKEALSEIDLDDLAALGQP